MKHLQFGGLDILRPRGEALRLSPEECVSYAILTDTYRGGAWGDLHWRRISQAWSAIPAEGGLQLCLQLEFELGAGTPEAADDFGNVLCERVEALFCRVRDAVGEDLFLLAERISPEFEGDETTFFEGDWFANSVLVVNAKIRKSYQRSA